MFTKPLTRAPRYILIKFFFLEIGLSYLNDSSLTHVIKNIVTTINYEGELHFKSALISTDNGRTSRLSSLYCVFIIKTSSHNTSYRFCLNFTNIEAVIGGKSARERF